jgi:hypothetical protein
LAVFWVDEHVYMYIFVCFTEILNISTLGIGCGLLHTAWTEIRTDAENNTVMYIATLSVVNVLLETLVY